MAHGCLVGVREEQLEEGDQVVRIPLARGVRLAERELAAGREPAEEGRVVDRQPNGSAGAEPARRPAGELDLERAAFETAEHAFEHRDGGTLQERPAARNRLRANAHARTLPSPGTNGGLWWNGTRLSHSRSASKWMSAVTCSGWSG